MLKTFSKDFFSHAGKRRRRFVFGVVALLAIAFITVPIPFLNGVHAQTAGPVQECSGINISVIGCLGTLLDAVVKMMGSLLLFLIDIFMGFVAYNDFANATPVAIGWSIVRDVVNMFFIVVLLVSAFATIIGYDSSNFRYDRVLPKLLLMAILINFSRTLIQLLIDFSQVIMLTFVNAFKDAAAGNFVTAFGLQNILRVYSGSATSTEPITLLTVITTYLLAIAVLWIMVLVMVAMIAFVIVRVVGLWMLLIFSPIALFATALPEKMKKGLGIFTSEYWSNLSGFLVGGPVMAFFLYLTLATTQRATQAQQTLARSTNLFSANNTTQVGQFLSAWGTSDQIATFIIALAMMLMGLAAGKKIAGALPGFNAVNSFLTSLPRRTAGLAAGAGAIGFRGASFVGRESARYARPVTAAAARAGLAIPGVRTAFRAELAGAAAARGKEQLTESKKLLEPTKGMRDNPALLARYRESLPQNEAGNKAREEIDKMLGKSEAGKVLLEQAKKNETGTLKEQLKGGIAAGYASIADMVKEKDPEATKSLAAAIGISRYRDADKVRGEEKAAAAKEFLATVGAVKGSDQSEEDKKVALDEASTKLNEKNNAADQKYNDEKNAIRAGTGGRLKEAALSKVKAPLEAFNRITTASGEYKSSMAQIGMNEKSEQNAVRERFKPQQDHLKDELNFKAIDKATYNRLNTELSGQMDQALANVKDPASGQTFDQQRQNAKTKFTQSAGGGSSTSLGDAQSINLSRGEAMTKMVENRSNSEAQVQADIQIRTQQTNQRKSDLSTERAGYQAGGDLASVAKIDSTYLSYPHLSPSQKDFDMNMGSVMFDKQLQENLSDEALSHPDVQRFITSKAVYEDPTSKNLRVDPQAKKELMKGLSKNVAEVAEAYLKNIERS